MKQVKYLWAATAFFALAGACQLPAAAQTGSVKAGVLTCSVDEGTGFIFGSSKDMRCVFEATDGSKDRYQGKINKFGIDIGVTGKAVLAWTVLAPTEKVGAGVLAGTYAGVAADASVGVGGGANLLVGGSEKTISLQPLSAQAQTGLNAALAIAQLELTAVR